MLSSLSADVSDSCIEIITIEKATPLAPPLPPPLPPLPLVELVISFIINGKETGERSLEINVNQDFKSFECQLNTLVLRKLPKNLTFESDGVQVSYKRAYVTKAQESKRKDLTWKDFVDDMDYSGLRNAIRSSKVSKMTLIVRAFITIPKADFEVEIEPIIASQRVVYLLLIRVDSRLLRRYRSRLWHHRSETDILSNSKLFKIDGDVQHTTASSVTNDTIESPPPSMLNWIPKPYLIGLLLLRMTHPALMSIVLLVEKIGIKFSDSFHLGVAISKHLRGRAICKDSLIFMCICQATLIIHPIIHPAILHHQAIDILVCLLEIITEIIHRRLYDVRTSLCHLQFYLNIHHGRSLKGTA